MKNVYLMLFLAGLSGCSKEERFVSLTDKSVPKSVVIYVSGLAHMTVFDVDFGTVPVMLSGAGVFISPNNHVLTCDHLFDLPEITGITVCDYTDSCTAGEILYKDSALDLALVRTFFSNETDYIRLANPKTLKVGQELIAIGNPLGFPFSVSHGIISALGRNELGIYNMTQSDTFLNPGNSGGPLINLRGELVGINSRIVPPIRANVFTGLGFSVQTGQIYEFLTRFKGLDCGDRSYWRKFSDFMESL